MSFETANALCLGRSKGQPRRRRRRNACAFTLIEVLVVVAIIALMIGILVPSLTLARSQAKVTICMANSKQIGTMIAQYQNANSSYVPIVYNYYANGHNAHDAPARACWLSIALRQYHPGGSFFRGQNGGKYDPNACWYPETGTFAEYEKSILPEFFVCPFQRGLGPGEVHIREDNNFRYYEWQGRHEHYQTWLWWPLIIRGVRIDGKLWPGAPSSSLNGVAKFSSFTWNMVRDSADPNSSEFHNLRHRRWTEGEARTLKSASLSDVTVSFCAQGEHLVLTGTGNKIGRVNVGGHRTGQGTGTNAIFADTHVEWVPGTRIGWP